MTKSPAQDQNRWKKLQFVSQYVPNYFSNHVSCLSAIIITHNVTVIQPIGGKFLSPQSTRSVSGRRGFIRIDSYKDFLIFDRVTDHGRNN